MNEINSRIAQVVKESQKTKTAFAEKIGLSQSYISGICAGKKVPSDRTISDICREYNVNEIWLKTGEGDPYILPEVALGAPIGSLFHGEPDFKKRLISVLLRMSPEEWEILEKKAWELVAEMEKGKKDAGPEGPAAEE